MGEQLITSPANPRLKALVALRRRRAREQTGTTLVEGLEELELALGAGVRPRSVFYCPELNSEPARLGELLRHEGSRSAEQVRLSRAAFVRVSYREGPDGVLAVVDSVGRRCSEIAVEADARPALVLLCEGVEKPGNLGAMLRTADAAGLTAVIAADPVTDWGNPNVVRASKGTVFSVPVAADPTEAALAWLGDHGIALVACTPQGEDGAPVVDYTQVDFTRPVAIAVGAEKLGLSRSVLDAADDRAAIEMGGRVNSLNVATSAAIVVYEALRQRRLNVNRRTDPVPRCGGG